MSQLRRNYAEFRSRGACLIEVGPNVVENAIRAFRRYLAGRELEFPYLCDPDWRVHRLYGLKEVGAAEGLKVAAKTLLAQVSSRPLVAPVVSELGRLALHPMEQGLFLIDGDSIIRYGLVTAPSGILPPVRDLLSRLEDAGTSPTAAPPPAAIRRARKERVPPT